MDAHLATSSFLLVDLLEKILRSIRFHERRPLHLHCCVPTRAVDSLLLKALELFALQILLTNPALCVINGLSETYDEGYGKVRILPR